MEESTENEILLSTKYIIIGKIIKNTMKIPKTPQELFITPMLEETARSDSFTDAPTNGTKLLTTNFAVFKDTVSALCAKTFLSEKTKVKIDITNTVIEVNAVRTDFEMPPNS